MKHFYVFMMALIASLFLGVVTSSAATKDEVDFGVMELNKTYNMKDSKYYYGTFTPEKDGYLQVYSNSTTVIRPFKVWKSSARETMALADNEYSHVALKLKDVYSYNYEMYVQKGVTYYMCGNSMQGDNIDVIMKMEPKNIEYFGCSVEENDEVSPTETNRVSFFFNRSVVSSSAAIIYGDSKEYAVSASASSYNCSLNVNLKEALLKLGTNGSVKEGDIITVIARGIKEDPDDAGDAEQLVYGETSVKVKVGKMPAMLLNATMDGVPVTANTKFLTYYAPGTGKLILNFSKPLDETEGEACLTFGDFDQEGNGGYYRENNDEKEGNFTFKVKGSQVIMDFSGKRRAINDMVSSTESNRGADFTSINLQISKITDTEGTRAYSTSSSTKGRFNYNFKLDVPVTNVTSEFTPANGASIKDEDYVEIWITDEETLSYQGVSFSYDQKENGIEPTPDSEGNIDIIKDVVVKMDEIQRVADADDVEEGAYILTVPVPEEVKNMKNVTVSLYKVTCADGKDYTDIIAAKYNVDTTGIENVSFSTGKAAKVYNLNGQLVREGKNLQGLQGIYVINGKKVVLK